jgi:hypothetical protein
MQLLGGEPAHGRLARAHETDERDVDDLAVVLHGHGLTDFHARRTLIIEILGAPASRRQMDLICFSGNEAAGRQRSQGKLKLELQRAPPLDSSTDIA